MSNADRWAQFAAGALGNTAPNVTGASAAADEMLTEYCNRFGQ